MTSAAVEANSLRATLVAPIAIRPKIAAQTLTGIVPVFIKVPPTTVFDHVAVAGDAEPFIAGAVVTHRMDNFFAIYS